MYDPIALNPFPAAAYASHDLLADLREIVARLARARFEHCLVIDLTRPDLGIPVVRVLVPDMVTEESLRRPPLRWLATLL
jgi:ribosomal protein S12 methylthiotransferase accessory factor YcaO